MRGHFKTRVYFSLALASLPVLAHAQSLDTWSLPKSDATTGAEGPVDAQNPVVRPATPEPGPATSPTGASPDPIPIIAAPPPPPPVTTSATPAPAWERPAAAPSPQASAPTTAPQAGSSAQETETGPDTAPVGSGEPAIQSRQPVASDAAVEAGSAGWPVWWWAIPAVVAILALGLFLFRRRRSEAAAWQEEALPEAEAEEEAQPSTAQPDVPDGQVAAKPLPPLPTPNFTSPPAVAPIPPSSPDDVSVAFHPISVRLSLFYATLQYRMSVTSPRAHAPLTLLGDLISAHASLSREEQLAPLPNNLAVLHELPALVPDETMELKGELQLPLPAIRALQQGGGAYFVPLVRLCLLGEDGTALRRVFTVGIPGNAAGLSPLRIDTGPRNFEPLAAREIDMARQFPLPGRTLPLDPQRAAG